MLTHFPGAPLSVIRGARIPRVVTQPAAGKPLTITFPGGGEYRWLLGQTTFTTAAEAGNRVISLSVTDATNTLWTQRITGTVPESASLLISLIREQTLTPPSIAAKAVVLGVPELPFQAGWQLVLSALELQAGDTFTAMTYYVEQIDNGPYGEELGVTRPSVQDLIEEPLIAYAR